MPLRVFVSSALRQLISGYSPMHGIELYVAKGTTVADVCKELNIPVDDIKIVMVNGRNQSLDYRLQGDERVALFPPIGGG
ncbi:MAG: MoaD/ThiS family protein [Desulfatiglans sp.]|nr:MoaD/ThiS family protein [Thermodesulfobacteriota bacterium]MEE4351588.1 MoaD/ThiS family protein [Desulfatiglans sp.]